MLSQAAPGRLAPSARRPRWLCATGGTYYVWMGQESDRMISLNPHYYEIRGRAAEIARAVGSPAGGAEHLFLGMLHDGGWPVSVLSPWSTSPGRGGGARHPQRSRLFASDCSTIPGAWKLRGAVGR